MVKTKPKTLEEILSKVDSKQKEITQKLRSLIKSTLPNAAETVRRGVITYILNGKDFARIHLYKDHVDLGLLVGTKMDAKLLQGRGKGKDIRHVKIVSTKNINEAEITRLLKEAAALT
jgi:hypothetical protein